VIVRLKLGRGRAVRNQRGKNRRFASAFGALLIPAALMAYVLGFWKLASDMGMTSEFAIRGLFSHWQLWVATGAALHITASVLNRYGRGGELHLPRALAFRFGKVRLGMPGGSPALPAPHLPSPDDPAPGGPAVKRAKAS
jgi:hypothetical protein